MQEGTLGTMPRSNRKSENEPIAREPVSLAGSQEQKVEFIVVEL